MDGSKVQEAVSTIRWCLESAIGFSLGYPNASGWRCVLREADLSKVDARLDIWREVQAVEHRGWQDDIDEATLALAEERFSFPVAWADIDVSNPQVALLDFPVELDKNNVPTGAIWGLGAGENKYGEKIPSDGLFDTFAGDHKFRLQPNDWRYEHNAIRREYKGVIAGVFDDSLVRKWEVILETVKSEERDLQKQQIAWQKGSPSQEIALNASEQSICEAIKRLWGKGLEWPVASDIAPESGLEVQTVKNNTAPMFRHGILEKGPSGQGFKVRT